MAVLNINYSQQIAEQGHLIQNSEGILRCTASGAGIVATGAYIGLAPFTFGLSLIPAVFTGVGTAALIDDTANNDDFNYLNNRKGNICLRNEKNEVESKLGKKKW